MVHAFSCNPVLQQKLRIFCGRWHGENVGRFSSNFSTRCQPNLVCNGFFFTLHLRRHLLNQIITQEFEGFEPRTKNSDADVLHTWQLNRRNFAKKYLGLICEPKLQLPFKPPGDVLCSKRANYYLTTDI